MARCTAVRLLGRGVLLTVILAALAAAGLAARPLAGPATTPLGAVWLGLWSVTFGLGAALLLLTAAALMSTLPRLPAGPRAALTIVLGTAVAGSAAVSAQPAVAATTGAGGPTPTLARTDPTPAVAPVRNPGGPTPTLARTNPTPAPAAVRNPGGPTPTLARTDPTPAPTLRRVPPRPPGPAHPRRPHLVTRHRAGLERYTVRPGDSFWSIAAARLAEPGRPAPTDEAIARYWVRLLAANRDRLPVPGQPDLLFTGDTVLVPPP